MTTEQTSALSTYLRARSSGETNYRSFARALTIYRKSVCSAMARQVEIDFEDEEPNAVVIAGMRALGFDVVEVFTLNVFARSCENINDLMQALDASGNPALASKVRLAQP